MFGRDMYSTASQMLRLPPHLRKTFTYSAPSDTHFRIVTCKTAAEQYGECKHYAEGFGLPLTPEKNFEVNCEAFRASGYVFIEIETPEGYPPGTRTLYFREGQRCLQSHKTPHRVSLERPPFLSIVEGDWRGNPRGTPPTFFNRAEDWINKLQTDTNAIADAIKKG